MRRLLIALLIALPVWGQLPITGAGPSALGGSLSLNPGWTMVQDGSFAGCSVGGSSCNPPTCVVSVTSCWAATTAGTVRVIFLQTGNANIHITSVTQSGETWNLCAASACHLYVSGKADADAAYSFGTSGGETMDAITVNFSGNTAGYAQLQFFEFLPPAGYSASLDSVAVSAGSTSCSSCTGANPTTSATDVVVQAINYENVIPWNGWTAPYFADGTNGNGICLNCSPSSAPTLTQSPAGYEAIVALAFKSSAGTFTVPSPVFSLVNFQSTGPHGSLTTCTSGTCPAITVTSTGSGNLGVFMASASSSIQNISSISGGGTWTCSSTLRAHDASNNELSICYNLSLTGSTTSITPTMSGTANISYAYYEVSRTSGSFVLDQAAATNNGGVGTGYVTGQALSSLSGTNDVIFAAGVGEGGFSSMTLYPLPNYFLFTPSGGGYAGTTGMQLNSTNGTAPIYTYPAETVATGVAAVAFK